MSETKLYCPSCGVSLIIRVEKETIKPKPEIDYNKLPWAKFKSGKGEWIFANLAETDVNAKALLELLEATDTKALNDGVYEYRLSFGKDKTTKFIHRFILAEVKK